MKDHFVHLVYKQNSISTLSPSELTIRLYNQCLKNLEKGRKKIEIHDIEGKNRYLKKSQEIIMELMSMLNMEQEGSRKIFSLYEYFNHTLIEANIQNNIDKIIEVENYLMELRNTTKEGIYLKRIKNRHSDQI